MHARDYLLQAQERSNGTIVTIFDEQYQMASVLFESMKMEHVMQVIQGPPGMGKTIAFLSVAVSLNDIGKRVLIASPTHNHIIDNLLREASWVFKELPPVMYGKSHSRYTGDRSHCPRQFEECKGPFSKECEKQQNNCSIAADYVKCKQANTVFTTHAYIVSRPSFINEFDVLLIDESHGLPNVIRNNSNKHLDLETLQAIIKQEKNSNIIDLLNDANEKFKKAVEIGRRSNNSPPNVLAQQTFDILKQAAGKSLGGSGLKDWKFLDSAKFSQDCTLVASKFLPKPEWRESLSVGLISATIEDARAHVRDCGFSTLIMRPPIKFETERFRKRFERRPIFGIIDGPRLGKGDMVNYEGFRNEANDIISKLVTLLDVVTLILCQNKRDAKSIQQALQKNPQIQNRLTILPEEEELDDADSCQEIINQEVLNGKNVIIATASSKLWEGANVPNLQYLIIDSLPYRRPDPQDKDITRQQQARNWKSMMRFMLNKIQQGIGRLVRSDDQWGIAVIIDERFYANHKQFFKELPNYITSEQILRWVEKKKIQDEIVKIASKLRAGKSGRKDKEISDYFK